MKCLRSKKRLKSPVITTPPLWPFFFNFLQFFLKKNEKKHKHSLKNWGQQIVWGKNSLLERGAGQHICSADGRKGGQTRIFFGILNVL